MITYHCMFKWATSLLQLCNYSQLGRKTWTRPTFAINQRLVAASMRMYDLYIQTNNLVADFWFAGDWDARVNEARHINFNNYSFQLQISPVLIIKIQRFSSRFMGQSMPFHSVLLLSNFIQNLVSYKPISDQISDTIWH